MVPEARLEATENGVVPQTEGWFVLNARDACTLPRARTIRVSRGWLPG